MKALLEKYTPASRKNADNATDPYLPRKSAPGVGICSRCHAIRSKKRWHMNEKEYSALSKKRGPEILENCPACRKIKDGFPSGVVLLRGDYLSHHRNEILKLILNEEKRAMGINPLERIISISEEDGDGGRMEIYTTDEKLAQRIGRELRKACGGTLVFKWSGDAKLLRVRWAREA